MLLNFDSYLESPLADSIFITSTTNDDILTLILSLIISAAGSDGISPNVVKHAPCICDPLTFVFILSLEQRSDTLGHKSLLSKLKYYESRGMALALVRSYLSERHQFITINNVNSDLKPITRSAPRGSIQVSFSSSFMSDLYM